MTDQLVTIVTGFILTTVLGGALGYFFQRRTWNHQHRVQIADLERSRAVQTFDDVSRILDKRLYRMRLLYSALVELRHDEELVAKRMEAYRDVLVEWNDSINRNLALVQRYFGASMRERLDGPIGRTAVEIGRSLQESWRRHIEGREPQADSAATQGKLDSLGYLIYQFNLDLIGLIQANNVGWLVPENRRNEEA